MKSKPWKRKKHQGMKKLPGELMTAKAKGRLAGKMGELMTKKDREKGIPLGELFTKDDKEGLM